MFVYNHSDLDLEDPFLSSYADLTYSERYGDEDDYEEPWAVYDPD